MRTELIHSTALHLSLNRRNYRTVHFGMKWTRLNNKLFSNFSYSRASDTYSLTQNSARYVENALTHFRKRTDGFIGSRTTTFQVKTKFSGGDLSWTLRMEFGGTWRSFLSHPPMYWRSISIHCARISRTLKVHQGFQKFS
jgi:hypothetical protein